MFTAPISFCPLQAARLNISVLSLTLLVTPVLAGTPNSKPVAPTSVTPSTTQYAGLTADAKCAGQYTNAINAATNASLGLQIAGVAAQAVALTADGVGLTLEAAGAASFATPAMIPGIVAQGVALAANVVALGTVSGALAGDLANAILSQEAAKLPQCDTSFYGTVQISHGGLITAGNSHFSNSIGVVENVNVGGLVQATDLRATNAIYSQDLVNTGLLTTTDLSITGQINAANLSVSNLVAQGEMATQGITNSGAVRTDSLSVTGQISSNGLANTGHIATTTFSATGLISTNGIVNNGNISSTSLTTSEGAMVGTTLRVGGDTQVGGNLRVTGSLSVGAGFGTSGAGSFLAQGERVIAVDAQSARMAHGANQVKVDDTGVAMSGQGAQLGLSGEQVTVTNASGHGMTVSATQTQISGGTSSTTLQLDDGGAHFIDSSHGGPARVTGIAAGTDRYDAVNVGQLQAHEKQLSQGIAATAAVANIPALEQGRTVALGVGIGHYNGASALAFAGSYRLSPNASFRASMALNGGKKRVVGAGASFAW